MTPTKTKSASSQSVKATLAVFWRAARKYRAHLFLIWLAVALGTAEGLITPLYYRKFFDVLAANMRSENGYGQLFHIILVILGLNLIGWFGWRSATFLNNFLQTHVNTDLRRSSFDYLMQHSYGFFAGSFSGSLVQKVNRLARSFEGLADSLNWNILPMIIRLIGITSVIFVFSHALAAILVAWIIVFCLVNYRLSMWKMKFDTESAARESEMTGALSDAITNHMNVQVFAALPRERSRFEDVTESHRKASKLAWDVEAVLEAVQAFLAVLIEFLIIYFALRFWRNGLLTIGTFVLFQAYVGQLINELWGFGRIMRTIYRSFADAEEMVTILNTSHEIKDAPAAKALAVNQGEIEFKDVRFGFYDHDVIKNLNMHIRSREKVALIGPSGAGKSTIIKLLFRFYELKGGSIAIDGQDIRSVTQESLREQISLVPQEPILFHRSLFDNIRYGKPDAKPEEVFEAARLAHCAEFIEALPEKYETYVGERGIKLSGGERQRIAIARAILKNAPILALDEATSSLDSHSEALIQEALDTLMRGKTVIVIAHRLSTVQKMDRIIVLEHGQIREEGTHAALLQRPDSLYAHLWQLQAGGFLKMDDAETAEKAERTVGEFYGDEEE